VSRPPQVTDQHINRLAVVYVRQSSPEQVREHVGSTALQRDLIQTVKTWGWPDDRIAVRDEDLGRSGSIPGHRQGFNGLIDDIRARAVGLVVVVDISRLARNEIEEALFVTVARQFDVLLAYGTTVIDFRDPNSAFVARILGVNAARENNVRIAYANAAKRKKVQAGIAITKPRVGYVWGPNRAWLKDPDPLVRAAIQLVFDEFLRLGSAGAVTRRLRLRGLKIPVDPSRVHEPIAWRDATRARVTHILKNPVYAGFYVYGTTQVDHAREPSPSGTPRRSIRHLSERLVVEHHHEPYIEPALAADIQRRLAENQYRAKPSPGRGHALLQGLLRCAIHKLGLRTLYSSRDRRRPAGSQSRRLASYKCPGTLATEARCAQLSARLIDQEITSVVLELLEPPSLADVQTALRRTQRDYATALRLRRDELFRTEQAVSQLERDRDQLGPDHQLYRLRLGDQIETALQKLRDLTTFQRLHPVPAPDVLGENELNELQRLLLNVRSLWHDPRVTNAQRKDLLRKVINAVDVESNHTSCNLTIHWVGGMERTLVLKSRESALETIRSEYDRGQTPATISYLLTMLGLVQRRGPKSGSAYDPSAVKRAIYRMRLQARFTILADAEIVSLREKHVPIDAIVADLNRRGIRHALGPWTRGRVWAAIQRMRRNNDMPPVTSLDDQILAFHHAGLFPPQIAERLAGTTTSRGRTSHGPTVDAVYRVLKRHGLKPNSIAANLRVANLLSEWAGHVGCKDMVSRLNALGLKTRRDRAWTLEAVWQRLRQLGLPAAASRRAARVKLTNYEAKIPIDTRPASSVDSAL
jgi:DNA invertase Pin-like site-specific DNA recombinase